MTQDNSWRSIMLVLSRKIGEKVVIGGNITVTLVEIAGNRVRLGISAPQDVRVLRAELVGMWETHNDADPAVEIPAEEETDFCLPSTAAVATLPVKTSSQTARRH